ncbi:MAG: glycoside hydrolase family 99-like domain-containing protein, partial [Anaerolineales bacterium]|nr:glycoside hydrolase family 99-like domain-containing protein [Anaerolineales bacterium]
TPDVDAIVDDYIHNVVNPDWLKFGLDWTHNRCERMNIAMRWWGHQWLYNEEELLRLAQLSGLRYRGRFAVGESQIPEFRGLEHRQASRLILEFEKPDLTKTTFSPPLVSVLIPAWNPRYFGEALSSVLSQTYQPLDIVIGDDCRSSEIEEITNKLSRGDQRVRYIHNPERLGGRKNILNLLRLAKGDFIKFLNDDDRLEPHCIERLLTALLACPGATLATSRRQQIDVNSHPLPDIIDTLPVVEQDSEIRGIDLATLLLTSGRNFIGEPSTVLFRKAALAHITPNPMSFDGKEIYGINDGAMWINLALRGSCIYLVEPLSSFRRHPEQYQVLMHEEVGESVRAGLKIMRSSWERLGLARHCIPNHLSVRSVGSKGQWRHVEVNHFGVEYRFVNAPPSKTKPSSVIEENKSSTAEKKPEYVVGLRAIAFYSPQFYPIPENDQWRGKGFTEWHHVTKAVPLFEGHYQPHLPTELGFYDLRLPQVLQDQAELARRYGIHGFCYYYYWFNGNRLIETPIDNMLKSGKPDFPFCLCWANENWAHQGDDDKYGLIEQTYNEVNAHRIIHDLLPFLLDRRYIRIENKPLLLVERADLIPNVFQMLSIWRSEAKSTGIDDLYLVCVESSRIHDPELLGFDAVCECPPYLFEKDHIISQEKMKFYKDFRGNILDYQSYA